jgi:hypothetical protein
VAAQIEAFGTYAVEGVDGGVDPAVPEDPAATGRPGTPRWKRKTPEEKRYSAADR